MMYFGVNVDSKYKGRRTKSDLLEHVASPIAKSRFIARNTVEYFDQHGTRYIRFHDTDILTFSPYHVRLESGGWKTLTTKDRLNTYLPAGFHIWTDRGVWHMRTPKLADVVFFDGITFDLDGSLDSPQIFATEAVKEAETDRKLIDAYMRKVRKVGIPSAEDSGGDPWIFPSDAMGGKVDAAIMREWLREKYVFRSLFYWAFRYAGMNDLGFAMYCDAKWNHGKPDKIVYTRLRRYIRVCLGMGD